MSQPVVDTLELCDALRKTGMQPDQAEGPARALGLFEGARTPPPSAIEVAPASL